MATVITKYRTEDGKEFESANEAERYDEVLFFVAVMAEDHGNHTTLGELRTNYEFMKWLLKNFKITHLQSQKKHSKKIKTVRR